MAPWHFLNLRSLPHGHGSLRPGFLLIRPVCQIGGKPPSDVLQRTPLQHISVVGPLLQILAVLATYNDLASAQSVHVPRRGWARCSLKLLEAPISM